MRDEEEPLEPVVDATDLHLKLASSTDTGENAILERNVAMEGFGSGIDDEELVDRAFARRSTIGKFVEAIHKRRLRSKSNINAETLTREELDILQRDVETSSSSSMVSMTIGAENETSLVAPSGKLRQLITNATLAPESFVESMFLDVEETDDQRGMYSTVPISTVEEDEDHADEVSTSDEGKEGITTQSENLEVGYCPKEPEITEAKTTAWRLGIATDIAMAMNDPDMYLQRRFGKGQEHESKHSTTFPTTISSLEDMGEALQDMYTSLQREHQEKRMWMKVALELAKEK